PAHHGTRQHQVHQRRRQQLRAHAGARQPPHRAAAVRAAPRAAAHRPRRPAPRPRPLLIPDTSTTMRHSLLLTPVLLLLAACGAGSPDTDSQVLAKRAERDSLKALREQLTASIAEVDGWLAKHDPSLQRSLPTVTTYLLEPRSFAHWTEAHGSVRADQNALLYSSMGGKVRRMLVPAGRPVSQGQLIVDIDLDALRENVAQA